MTTSMGSITIELFQDKAPETVRNFLKYADGGHYDDTIFHRVYKGQAIQGGAFDADGKPVVSGVPIFNEADNGLKNRRYTLAMTRQPDFKHSATCQFFINLADNSMLDHRDGSNEGYGYCVFGKVVEGTDVVDRIGEVPTHDTQQFDQTPVEVVRIETVRRLR
jgi:cyclophilin family peptidyl-prolyl cis-trans isomerase